LLIGLAMRHRPDDGQPCPIRLSQNPRTEHGGSLRLNRRKLQRPLNLKRPLHVTLRAECAKGPLSLLNPRHRFKVNAHIYRWARKRRIRILEYANVGNHLHLLVINKSGADEEIRHFFRTIGAQIAIQVTGAKRGKPFGKFWDNLLYSRIVAWGKDFTNVTNYVLTNSLEASHLWFMSDRLRKGNRRRAPPS